MASKLTRKIRQALALPPHIAARKAVEILLRSIRRRAGRRRDSRAVTYALKFSATPLLRYIHTVPLPNNAAHCELIRRTANLALEHRFDMLGSGAVRVEFGMQCAGTEGNVYSANSDMQVSPANRAESARISALLPRGYERIDWQRDFKSGYRWSEAVWHKDLRYGNVPGADVKVPWELARMQYLPTMAQAAALAAKGSGGFALPEEYAQEFAAQVTDFIAANPPRFGVNWVTSMDVGIRAANWLIAYDMFRANGVEFPEDWEKIFRRSIYEHAAHIASNLEWSSGLRGNHYLADIVGLLFCAAWLPRSPETDVWLAFGVQELIAETELQFLPDGGNFEASVPYHRLSAEMVVYAAALIVGLPDEKRTALKEYDRRLWKFKPVLRPAPIQENRIQPASLPSQGGKNSKVFRSEEDSDGMYSPLPSSFWEKLRALCRFTADIAGNNLAPQIGDNDSGRFIIGTPIAEILPRNHGQTLFLNLAHVTDLPDEVMIPVSDNHAPLLAAAAALSGFEEYMLFVHEFPAEYGIAIALQSLLAKRDENKSHSQDNPLFIQKLTTESLVDKRESKIPPSTLSAQMNQRRVTPDSSLAVPNSLSSFPDFGLTIVRSGEFIVSLRCGAIGQRGKGGHAHNDQLSITLSYGGQQIFVDTGTYLYTPAPSMRNRFRSAAMHNTLILVGKEQNDWLSGGGDVLFWMLGDRSQGRIIEQSANRWIAEHYGYGTPHRRDVRCTPEAVLGTDECAAQGEQFLIFHLAPEVIATPNGAKEVMLTVGDAVLRFTANGVIEVKESLYSRGYGWLQRTHALRVERNAEKNERFIWEVSRVK